MAAGSITPKYTFINKPVEQSRRFLYSNVRIFAAFSVIVGHVSFSYIIDYSPYTRAEWWIGSIYQWVFRSGLPLFLFLTGALLLPKASNADFVKKRVLRLLYPFIFWNIVYAFVDKYPGGIYAHHNPIYLFVLNSLHLWFIYVMCFVYTLMPLLKFSIERYGFIILKLCAAIYLGFCVFYYFTYVTDIKQNSLESFHIYYPHVFLLFPPFVIFGYFFFRNESVLRNVSLGVFLFLLGVVVSGATAYWNLTKGVAMNNYFYRSFNAHIFLKALGTVILVNKATELLPLELNLIIDKISKYAFGIYLVHPVVLKYQHLIPLQSLFKYHYSQLIFSLPLVSLFTFFVSLLIIYLLSKLPFGRYLY